MFSAEISECKTLIFCSKTIYPPSVIALYMHKGIGRLLPNNVKKEIENSSQCINLAVTCFFVPFFSIAQMLVGCCVRCKISKLMNKYLLCTFRQVQALLGELTVKHCERIEKHVFAPPFTQKN